MKKIFFLITLTTIFTKFSSAQVSDWQAGFVNGQASRVVILSTAPPFTSVANSTNPNDIANQLAIQSNNILGLNTNVLGYIEVFLPSSGSVLGMQQNNYIESFLGNSLAGIIDWIVNYMIIGNPQEFVTGYLYGLFQQ